MTWLELQNGPPITNRGKQVHQQFFENMRGQIVVALPHLPLEVRDWLLVITHLQLVVIVVDPGKISVCVLDIDSPVGSGALPVGVGLVQNPVYPDMMLLRRVEGGAELRSSISLRVLKLWSSMIDIWMKISDTWSGVRMVLISDISSRSDIMDLTSTSAGTELRSLAVRPRLLRLRGSVTDNWKELGMDSIKGNRRVILYVSTSSPLPEHTSLRNSVRPLPCSKNNLCPNCEEWDVWKKVTLTKSDYNW